MEANECQNIMSLASQHFTKATDTDLKMIWDGVKGYTFEDAERAIKEHRLECGKQAYRPDIRRIINLAAGFYNTRRRVNRPRERIVDSIRKFYPFAVNEADIIREHFTGSWASVVEQKPDPRGEAIARAFIMANCRCALMEIGWSQKDADDAAHLYVGLEPGEKIPKQGIFRELPKPLSEVKSWDAIVALGKASLAASKSGVTV